MTRFLHPNGRNARTVWTIASSPFKGAHFATFPPELPELCISAGTSEHGACRTCGAPWERHHVRVADGERREVERGFPGNPQASGGADWKPVEYVEAGWQPTCSCADNAPVPCTVLDPFGGAGTTALVAERLQRDAILCEMNPEYAEIARARIASEAPMFADIAVSHALADAPTASPAARAASDT